MRNLPLKRRVDDTEIDALVRKKKPVPHSIFVAVLAELQARIDEVAEVASSSSTAEVVEPEPVRRRRSPVDAVTQAFAPKDIEPPARESAELSVSTEDGA